MKAHILLCVDQATLVFNIQCTQDTPQAKLPHWNVGRTEVRVRTIVCFIRPPPLYRSRCSVATLHNGCSNAGVVAMGADGGVRARSMGESTVADGLAVMRAPEGTATLSVGLAICNAALKRISPAHN